MLKKIPEIHRDNTRIALIASAAVGPVGALSSAGDIAAVSSIWGTLLYSMFKESVPGIDKETAKKIALSVLIGAAGYYGGCKMATRLFNMIPGAGTLIGMGVSSVANILFTYRFALVTTSLIHDKTITLDTFKDVGPFIATLMRGRIGIDSIVDIVNLYIE